MEVYKKIENYSNYYVSNLGNIKNMKTGRILIGKVNSSGFLNVGLWYDGKLKTFTIHALVARAFLENPFKQCCVLHLDGDKLNNNMSNLMYCSYSMLLTGKTHKKKYNEKSVKEKHKCGALNDTLTLQFD